MQWHSAPGPLDTLGNLTLLSLFLSQGGNFLRQNLENEGSVSGSDSTFIGSQKVRLLMGLPNGRLEDWKRLQIVRSLIALGPLMELCYCVSISLESPFIAIPCESIIK